MAIISKEGILKVLTAYNPWWKNGIVNPKMTKSYKRFAFYEAMKRLKETGIRRTVVLTGTRRVGKTTIQYQMIETLLKNGDIVYQLNPDRGIAKGRCIASENRIYFNGSSHVEIESIPGSFGLLSREYIRRAGCLLFL